MADALQLLEDAIRDDPRDSEILVARGLVYHELGDAKHALKDLDAAIRYRPSYCWARLQRARLYWKLQRLQDAADEFEYLTLTLAPDNADYQLEYGRFLMHCSSWRNAIRIYEKVIRLNPESEEAYLMRGLAASELERHEEAVTDLYQYHCLSSQRTDPSTLVNAERLIQLLMASVGGRASEECRNTLIESLEKSRRSRAFIGYSESEFVPATEVLTWAANEMNGRIGNQPTVQTHMRRVHILTGGSEAGRRPAGCSVEVLSDRSCVLTLPQRIHGFIFLIAAILHDDASNRFGPEIGDWLRTLADAKETDSGDLTALWHVVPGYLSQEALVFGNAAADIAMAFLALRECAALCGWVFYDSHYSSLGLRDWIWCNEIWADTEAVRRLKQGLPANLHGKVDMRTWVYALSGLFTFVALYDGFPQPDDARSVFPPPGLRLGRTAMELIGNDEEQRKVATGVSESYLDRLSRLASCVEWRELGNAGKEVLYGSNGQQLASYFEPRFRWFQALMPEEVLDGRADWAAQNRHELNADTLTEYETLVADALRMTPNETAIPQRAFDAMIQYAEAETKRLADVLRKVSDDGAAQHLNSIDVLFVDDENRERKGCYAHYFEGGRGVVVIPITTAAVLDVLGGLFETAVVAQPPDSEEVASGNVIPHRWRESLDRCRATFDQLAYDEAFGTHGLQTVFMDRASTAEKLASIARIRSQLHREECYRESVPSNLGHLALTFAIAHEIAHHLKQHDKIYVALRDRFGGTVPLNDADWAFELEADSIATRSSRFKIKEFSKSRLPYGFSVGSYDAAAYERASVLRATLLLFGTLLLHSPQHDAADEFEPTYNDHPDLGIRLRSLREWCFRCRDDDDLYVATSLEFADHAWQISQQTGCPAIAALGAIALTDEKSEAEYRRVWQCIEVLDHVFAQLVVPGVADDHIRPSIKEIGKKLRGNGDGH